jgi:hypothetical protein
MVLLQRGGTTFVDGDTWNFLYFNELLELCPGSVAIHVVRDPRDVVCSMVKQDWCPKDYGAAARYYGDLMDRWHAVGCEHSHLLRLEDLIRDPRSALAGICSIIGLSYDPAMEEVDLSKGNVGRWREELTSKVASELSVYARKWGYE